MSNLQIFSSRVIDPTITGALTERTTTHEVVEWSGRSGIDYTFAAIDGNVKPCPKMSIGAIDNTIYSMETPTSITVTITNDATNPTADESAKQTLATSAYKELFDNTLTDWNDLNGKYSNAGELVSTINTKITDHLMAVSSVVGNVTYTPHEHAADEYTSGAIDPSSVNEHLAVDVLKKLFYTKQLDNNSNVGTVVGVDSEVDLLTRLNISDETDKVYEGYHIQSKILLSYPIF